MKKPHGVSWSKAEEDYFCELSNQGISLKEQARLINQKFWNGASVRTAKAMEGAKEKLKEGRPEIIRAYVPWKNGSVSFSDADLKLIRLYKNPELTLTEIAQTCNMSTAQAKSRLNRMKTSCKLLDLTRDGSTKIFKNVNETLKGEDTSILKLQGEISQLKQKLAEVKSQETLVSETIKEVVKPIKTIIKPYHFIIKKGVDMKKPETAMVDLADWHYGSKIKAEDIMGISEYNIDIAKERMSLMTLNLLECLEIIRHKIPIRKLVVNNLGDMCLVPGTKILTKEGFKSIETIKEGELVLTHKNRWRKVLRTFKREVSEEICSFSTIGQDNILQLTQNHPVWNLPLWFSYWRPKGMPDFIKAGDIKEDSLVFNRINTEFVRDLEVIDLLSYIKKSKEIMESNGRLFSKSDGFKQNSVPRFLKVDSNFCKFIGLFLGDGNSSKVDSYKGKIALSFELNKKNNFCRETVFAFLKQNSISYEIQRRGRCESIYFYSKPFSIFLREQFYNFKFEKCIPNWVLNLPIQKFRDIMWGLAYSDGSFGKKHKYHIFRIVNSAKDLLDAVKLRLEQEGILLILNKVKEKVSIIKGRQVVHTKPLFELSLFDRTAQNFYDCFDKSKTRLRCSQTKIVFDYVLKKLKKIEKCLYSGFVHNLEVEEDNSYIANGIILHNCEGEDIFPGQGRSIDLILADQVMQGSDEFISRFYLPLLSHFNEIVVYCINGNHGRGYGKKGTMAERTNWDYMFYQMLAQRLKAYKNIKFFISQTPALLYQLPEAPDHTHLLIHGSGVKGFSGIPYYGLDRLHTRYVSLLGTPISVLHLGHFHEQELKMLPRGERIMSGSPVGGSEFSVNALQSASSPKQIFYGFNNKWGKTWHFDIRLGELKTPKPDKQGVYTPVSPKYGT